MAAQIAEKIFKVGKVLVRIGDPQKEEFFAKNYGLSTVSLIILGSDYIERVIGTSPVRNGEVNAR